MQTRNARIETLGGAAVRFPFGVTVRRALVAVCGFAALAGCATLVGCSSDDEEEPAVVEEPQDPEETQVSTEPGIPITITAEYAPGTNLAAKKPIPLESVTEEGYAQKNRIRFMGSGTDVSAVWDAGDQIYVVCNGKISLLSLQSGAGTNKGTFSGVLAGFSVLPSPQADLICYIKNARNPNAITVQEDGTFTDNRDFFNQTGLFENAVGYTIYRGSAKYGTGSNIVVNFNIYDTCISVFELTPSNEQAYEENYTVANPYKTQLTYFQGDVQLAKCIKTSTYVGPLRYYLAIKSGSYNSAAHLEYTSTAITKPRTVVLGNNNAVTLETGKYYSKKGITIGYELGDYIYSDGTWGDLENHPNGEKGVARVCKLCTYAYDSEQGFTNGYAFSLETIPSAAENGAWEVTNKYHFPYLNNDSEYSGLEQTLYFTENYRNSQIYGHAPRTAYIYRDKVLPPSGYSSWFLPSYILAKTFFDVLPDGDGNFFTITEESADRYYYPKTGTAYLKENRHNTQVRPFIAF
ncbi:MAG: hypothetical protein J6M53_04595 [Bacteroidaceae bacterium]|nr:hypothetical protein [Bacteroidaceae bacterium]